MFTSHVNISIVKMRQTQRVWTLNDFDQPLFIQHLHFALETETIRLIQIGSVLAMRSQPQKDDILPDIFQKQVAFSIIPHFFTFQKCTNICFYIER